MFDRILADSGEGELKGAVERCGTQMRQIPVNDPGTLHDADTPTDFSALVDYHNSQLVRPVISVSLNKEKPFFDAKIAMLLTLYAARERDKSLMPPGSEPPEQGLARFAAAMQEAAQVSPGDFAVVAHGGVIELFLQKITGRCYKPRYCERISLIWDNERLIQWEEIV